MCLRSGFVLLMLAITLQACRTNKAVTFHGPGSDERANQIREIGLSAVDHDGIVGLSIGVAVDGRIVFAQGFGYANVEKTVRADADTIYDIASAGKHFTAASIVCLIERGKLSLDTRARSLLPELPAHFPDATVEQLLRHTSGFVGGELDELNPPADFVRKRYGVELLSDIELMKGSAMFVPGETWVYCNPGYLVLGILVERASGKRYDAFVRDELLRPNGLHEIVVCDRALPPRMSDGIHRGVDGIAEVPYIDMTAYSGQGSICSSVIDLLRWSHALNTGQVISVDSLAQFRSPTTLLGDHETAAIPYGFAQRLGAIGGYDKVGHTGTFDGGSAALAYYPDAKLEIAVLTNTRGQGTPHAFRIETEIAKRMLNITDPDVSSQRVPVTDAMKRAIDGTYSNGTDFSATIEGDELVVYKDGKVIERLVHIGDMRFRNVDDPDLFEWFLMDGERAGWWVYSMSGNFLEVLRRKK